MNDWARMSLREAGVELIDCVHKTPAASLTGRPYVGIPQMKDGRITFQGARRISEADYVEWTRKVKPQKHDVVLSRRTNPGVTAVFDNGDFALGQNLVLLRSDGRRVVPEFVRWLASGPEWWSQIEKYLNVGAVFDSLRCGDVPKFELTIPPKDDQRRIAQALGALDEKIELNRRMNQTLEAIARAIFRDWFIDFGPTRAKMSCATPYLAADLWDLFPGKLDDNGRPERWGDARLGDYFKLERGLSYRGQYLADEGIPLINLGCFLGGGSFAHHKIKRYGGEYANRHVVSAGTLLLANTDVTQDRVILGSPYLVEIEDEQDDAEGPLFTHHIYAARALSESARQWTKFFYYNLLEPQVRRRIEGFATGTTVLFLPRDAVEDSRFVCPPDHLRDAFYRTVEPLHDLAVSNRKETRSLAQTRDVLVPKLLSGEIRLKDAERLLEEVV